MDLVSHTSDPSWDEFGLTVTPTKPALLPSLDLNPWGMSMLEPPIFLLGLVETTNYDLSLVLVSESSVLIRLILMPHRPARIRLIDNTKRLFVCIYRI